MERYDIHEEPAGEAFEHLIDWLLDRAEIFLLATREPIVGQLRRAGLNPDLGRLDPLRAAIVRPNWYRFPTDDAARPVLARADRLYAVEDLAFFRDGSGVEPLLETISHEKDAWLVLDDDEARHLRRTIS